MGSIKIVLLQIVFWFWQRTNFENRLKFCEIIRCTKNGVIFGPPCKQLSARHKAQLTLRISRQQEDARAYWSSVVCCVGLVQQMSAGCCCCSCEAVKPTHDLKWYRRLSLVSVSQLHRSHALTVRQMYRVTTAATHDESELGYRLENRPSACGNHLIVMPLFGTCFWSFLIHFKLKPHSSTYLKYSKNFYLSKSRSSCPKIYLGKSRRLSLKWNYSSRSRHLNYSFKQT